MAVRNAWCNDKDWHGIKKKIPVPGIEPEPPG